jgi:hypothetical protein
MKCAEQRGSPAYEQVEFQTFVHLVFRNQYQISHMCNIINYG